MELPRHRVLVPRIGPRTEEPADSTPRKKRSSLACTICRARKTAVSPHSRLQCHKYGGDYTNQEFQSVTMQGRTVLLVRRGEQAVFTLPKGQPKPTRRPTPFDGRTLHWRRETQLLNRYFACCRICLRMSFRVLSDRCT